MKQVCAVTFAALFLCLSLRAQDAKPADSMQGMQMDPPKTSPQTSPKPCVEDMPGMTMCPPPSQDKSAAMPAMKMSPGMDEMMQNMHPHSFIQQIMHHASSGTSAEPNSTATPMLMTMKGPWMLMFHANVFITDTQQTGPRGADKFRDSSHCAPCSALSRRQSRNGSIPCSFSKARLRSASP
jgi:hypothetical protein